MLNAMNYKYDIICYGNFDALKLQLATTVGDNELITISRVGSKHILVVTNIKGEDRTEDVLKNDLDSMSHLELGDDND